MKISYGVCVSPNYNEEWLHNLVTSIETQNHVDEWEIILIGEIDKLRDHDLTYVEFDDSERPGHITKKKNILARVARYENLCLMHDYMKLDSSWFEGVVKTDINHPNWKVMLNPVITKEGDPSASWIVDPDIMQSVINMNSEYYTSLLMKNAQGENAAKYVAGLPYNVDDLSHIQYVPGGFFLVKTQVLLDHPFDETLVWGMSLGEDVEWSRRLRHAGIRFTPNSLSDTRIQKPNKWHCRNMPQEFIGVLREIYGSSK